MVFPEGDLNRIPKEERTPWFGTISEARNFKTNNPGFEDQILSRGEYIQEWYKRGYATPKGGWDLYEIHHIRPREFGGTGYFDNFAPLLKDDHRKLVTPWWNAF